MKVEFQYFLPGPSCASSIIRHRCRYHIDANHDHIRHEVMRGGMIALELAEGGAAVTETAAVVETTVTVAETAKTASTAFGRTVQSLKESINTGSGVWRRVAAHAEQAAGRAYRGGTSIEEVFVNQQTGERVVRHIIVKLGKGSIDDHGWDFIYEFNERFKDPETYKRAVLRSLIGLVISKAASGRISRITPGSLSKAEEAGVNRTLFHIDAGTRPSGALGKKWGVHFNNKDGDLPGGRFGASPYREYRVDPSPGMRGAGENRIVVNHKTGEAYYSWTHYGDTGRPAFVKIR